MYIQEGSITISELNGIDDGNAKWTLSNDAVVVVPEGKTAYLQLTGASNTTRGVELVIPEGATMTINGTLRGVAGNNSSDGTSVPTKITINGLLDTTDGVLSIGAKPTVSIESTGQFIIGTTGIYSGTTSGKYTITGKITLAAGGSISVVEGSACDNINTIVSATESGSLHSYTDASGNTVYGTIPSDGQSENYVAAIGGEFYTSLDTAVDAAASGDTIILVNNAQATLSKDIPEGVTLAVPSGTKLTVEVTAAQAVLESQGTVMVSAGGTVVLPIMDEGNPSATGTWVGSDTDARLQLSNGTITYDFNGNTLTLNGEATVPANQTAYLHLAEGFDAVITDGSTLTVASGGTLKAVSGSSLTVAAGGKLDVGGTLTISENATVDVAGTLALPLLTETVVKGTGDGTGMKGDIVIHKGADVTYASYTSITGTGGQLTLSNNAQATLNLADAALTLNRGTATVNGTSDTMYTMLPLGDGAGTTNMPLSVTIDEDAAVSVPTGKTLKVVSGSSMTIDGALDVDGVLTVAQGVTGFTVNGTLDLPVMSKEQMAGTVDGTGIRGDITINEGASVTYAGENIVGGADALLTLSEDASAILNVSNANADPSSASLTLTKGTATVAGENGSLKAMLVTDPSADGGNLVPFDITIASGAPSLFPPTPP